MAIQIGFVILHYMTADDTKNCVESVKKNVPRAPVVIVDNASNNQSGIELQNFYLNDSQVSVLLLQENKGFACGNNAGIQYIRKLYSPKFVVVMNNDTILLENNFSDIVEEEYTYSNFAVLGPKIITKDGNIHTNPVESIVRDAKLAKKMRYKRMIKLLLNYVHLGFLFHNVGEGMKYKGIYDNDKRYVNVKLHGSCWIFSPIYFENFSGLNSKTFLYFEEDILYAQLTDKELITVYNPALVIKHLEDSATNSVFKKSRKKNIFVLKNEIKSLRILEDILKA